MPPQQVQLWLEDWLLNDYDEKILIYIGRDFDAAPGYWSWAQQSAPPEQQKEVSRLLREAKADFARDRSKVPQSAEWPGWFSIDGSLKS